MNRACRCLRNELHVRWGEELESVCPRLSQPNPAGNVYRDCAMLFRYRLNILHINDHCLCS